MTRQEVIARLRSLREEIERDNEVGIAALETTFALVLSDVCCALELTAQEHDQVLGPHAAAYVTRVRQERYWPMERHMERETATVTLTEPVAVPA